MSNTVNEQKIRRLIESWKALGLSEAEAKIAVQDMPGVAAVVADWGKEMGRRLGLNEAEASIFATLFKDGRR